MQVMDIALICKALSDANRLQIVTLLTEGEMCACKLLEHFEISQPTLSHHMKILTETQLVTTRKEGKWSHYALNEATFAAFNTFMSGLKVSAGEAQCLCK